MFQKVAFAFIFGVIGLTIAHQLIREQSFNTFLDILFATGIIVLVFGLFVYSTFLSTLLVAAGGFMTGSLGYYLWDEEGL
ncbi:MAG: hypothetical protein H6850_02945 [Alphaproteobacteria bacterium]|nr:MAG: hypothetical protein H6850_02945 [Alphaproteobacteria bacterium]